MNAPEKTVAQLEAELAQMRKENKELRASQKAAVALANAREAEFKKLIKKLWARGETADGVKHEPGAVMP